MPKKKKLSSGDWLIDWYYWRFIQILNNDEWDIQMKRRLKNPDEPADQREILCGMVDMEEKIIYLNPAFHLHPTKDALGRTLAHELAHILYCDVSCKVVTHRNIYQLEELWSGFSDRQKEILLSFIPKKFLPKK